MKFTSSIPVPFTSLFFLAPPVLPAAPRHFATNAGASRGALRAIRGAVAVKRRELAIAAASEDAAMEPWGVWKKWPWEQWELEKGGKMWKNMERGLGFR